MSNFSQKEQTEIVGDAMNLTRAIQNEEAELAILRRTRFEDAPKPPVRKMIKPPQQSLPVYPDKPKANITFGDYINNNFKSIFQEKKLLYILLGITVLGIAAVYFLYNAYVKYRAYCDNEIVRLSASPEYQQAVMKAERIAAEANERATKDAKERQALLDAEYEKQKTQYDTVVMPDYCRKKELWEHNHKRKIHIIEEDLKRLKLTLKDLYEETLLISATYRELPLLQWLYTDMSTSDHDIRYATELLDRDRQRALTMGTIVAIQNMDCNMRRGFNALYHAIEEGNEIHEDILAEVSTTNALIEKSRRDMGYYARRAENQRDKIFKNMSK